MDFRVSVDRLLNQVGHWEEPRWRGRSEPVRQLVQQLADLTAEAEGQPRRVVTRLNDVILPDQLRVVADDLLAAEPSPATLEAATALVDRVRESL